MSDLTFGIASSADHRAGALAVRRLVFIEEQGVPAALEMDDRDDSSIHLAAFSGSSVIGAARMYGEPNGDAAVSEDASDWHVGRVAVLPQWRRQGVGSGLMQLAHQVARERGARTVHLNAQISVLAFYERLGYRARGRVFLDAGIPHRAMSITLNP